MGRPISKKSERRTAHLIWVLAAAFFFAAALPVSNAAADSLLIEECEAESVDTVDDDVEEDALTGGARYTRYGLAVRVAPDLLRLRERALLASAARPPPLRVR